MRVFDPNGAGVYWHIIIAPHFDDAVLSLGGTIARLTASGQRVLVATICAGIPLDTIELGPFAKRILHGVAPASWVIDRREEDRRALDLLDADYYWEGALDAIFRVPNAYGARKGLFGRPVAGDPLVLRAKLSIYLLEHFGRRAMIYAPLGVGGHVDHRIVHDAVRDTVWKHAIGWYEDFPYAIRTRRAVAERVAELEEEERRKLKPVSIDIAGTIDRRIEAIGAYRSQIGNLFGSRRAMVNAVRRHAGRDCTERVWVSA